MNPKVLLICGSPAPHSHTRGVLEALSTAISKLGGTPTLIDLLELTLPPCDPAFHRDPMSHPDASVREFVSQVEQTGAVVIGTPLYHGSFSGVLKNALDHLASDAFDDKPVGLVSNGAGIRACMIPCEHLRAVVRAMGGMATQSQIGSTKSDFECREDGSKRLVNPDILNRVDRMARELIALSIGMSAKRLAEARLS